MTEKPTKKPCQPLGLNLSNNSPYPPLFVSYITEKGGMPVSGHATLQWPWGLHSEEDIEKVLDAIEKDKEYDAGRTIIIFWKRMEI